MYGQPTYLGDDSWKRRVAPEIEPISGKTAEEFNTFWEGRSHQWYGPYDWINPDNSDLFTDKTSALKRYMVMLYYG